MRLDDNGIGEDILSPRITFTSQLGSGHTLMRRQFSLTAAYATTFNSCQGLTLDRMGADLTKPVFSHYPEFEIDNMGWSYSHNRKAIRCTSL